MILNTIDTLLTPKFISPAHTFLPHSFWPLHTSSHVPSHHFGPTVFWINSCSAAFVLSFLCTWYTPLCNQLCRPKTLEVSLTPLSLQPKCISSANYIDSKFKLYPKPKSLLMPTTPTILVQAIINVSNDRSLWMHLHPRCTDPHQLTNCIYTRKDLDCFCCHV